MRSSRIVVLSCVLSYALRLRSCLMTVCLHMSIARIRCPIYKMSDPPLPFLAGRRGASALGRCDRSWLRVGGVSGYAQPAVS